MALLISLTKTLSMKQNTWNRTHWKRTYAIFVL